MYLCCRTARPSSEEYTGHVHVPPTEKGGEKLEQIQKEKKIKSEISRLNKIYAEIDDKKRAVISGLIQRAAFMRISLNELEDDLNANGFTEDFSQGNQEPYKRKRPAADLYNTINVNYQKIIRQLTDLLPKEVAAMKENEDGFDSCVSGRDNA